ncbi:AMP-dependent synthetase/ligase [Dermabacteraceae bacterium P13115]
MVVSNSSSNGSCIATSQQIFAQPHENLTELLLRRQRSYPLIPLFKVKREESLVDLSTASFVGEVRQLAGGLIDAGMLPGDRVAIMSRTRYEWSLVDWAIWFAGGVSVPVYETSSPEQVSWILSNSQARYAFVETQEHVECMESVRTEAPELQEIWSFAGSDLDRLRLHGSQVPREQIELSRTSRRADDLATIIYTSGTTGRPKGVMLTHRNLLETSLNGDALLGKQVAPPGSSTLLFLPLAHIFARFVGLLAVQTGMTLTHAPDAKKLVSDIQEARPTFLLGVPRVFEKIYAAAQQKAGGGLKGKLFRYATNTAVEYSHATEEARIPLLMRARHALCEALVYRKLRASLGGRARWAVSGGAALNETLARFFHGAGITILEGYGLTETSAPVCVNVPWNLKLGTVGPPLPGGQMRLSEDGDIQVKGCMVFNGYYNNPEATAECFTEDGWFNTGDLGAIDEDGHLRINGRRKEIIVTAGGKNVSPAPMEDRLRSHPLIGQAMVVGENRPFISCLLTLDREGLHAWLKERGISPRSAAAAAALPAVRKAIQEAIDFANRSVSRAESIRSFKVVNTDFTEENGYLTPSMKLKRHLVAKDFAQEIENLYRR